MPALTKAEDAVMNINKDDITEIKMYQNPPAGVSLVMEAVCILLQEKTDWNSAKLIMGKKDFLQRL